jgi:hypothetical protein
MRADSAVNEGSLYDGVMRAVRGLPGGAVAALVAIAIGLLGCGGRPPVPKRGVVEGDVGGWKFRRFQPVLDVEVWVADNRAEAFTASYVRDEAERSGRIADRDVVNVFVTRYQRERGVLRETVKLARRLAQESGYSVDESKIGGVQTVSITGHGEAWVMWAAGKYVVKVGGRGRDDVPSGMVSAYGARYPSVLPGSVLEGPLPPGSDADAVKPTGADVKREAPYDPEHPDPDWKGYDPKKPLPKPRQPDSAP